MTKRILVSIFSLLLSTIVFGQSITGQWIQSLNETDDNCSISITETMNLKESGQVMESALVNIDLKDDKNSVALKFRVSCSGEWQYSEGILVQTFEASTLKSELLDKPEGLPKAFVNMFSRMASSEFKKACKKPSRNKVISLTSDTLKIKDLGEKDAEVETFRKKN